MKTRFFSFCAAALLMVLLTPVSGVPAEEKDVREILKGAKAVFEPEKPSIRQVVITLKSKDSTVKWIAAQATKRFPDGRRVLLVTLEPEALKGTAYLFRERKDDPNKMYLYLPFVRRVREIVSSEQYERFLASDFTYFDLQFIRIHERFKLLGEEEVNDTTAYKLEETYPEASPYSKSIAWVDKETLRPLQRHYYDNKGDLWKIETVEDVTVINGVPTPMKITMKDVQNGTSTELKLSEVQYCGELADKLFEPENLPEVSSNPIWQPYCTLPSE